MNRGSSSSFTYKNSKSPHAIEAESVAAISALIRGLGQLWSGKQVKGLLYVISFFFPPFTV